MTPIDEMVARAARRITLRNRLAYGATDGERLERLACMVEEYFAAADDWSDWECMNGPFDTEMRRDRAESLERKCATEAALRAAVAP